MVINLPFITFGVILDTNSDVVPNTRVSIRNDTSGEIINVTTNTLGRYAGDLGNLTSGYVQTDRITVVCAFGLEDGESSFLISDDTHEVNITLTTVADSSDLTYCTVQDVLDELGDKTTADISFNRIRKLVLRAEAEIDDQSGTKFSSTTITDEIYDLDQYTSYKSPDQLLGSSTGLLVGSRNDSMNLSFRDRIILRNGPLISVTSLYKNNASKSSADIEK